MSLTILEKNGCFGNVAEDSAKAIGKVMDPADKIGILGFLTEAPNSSSTVVRSLQDTSL